MITNALELNRLELGLRGTKSGGEHIVGLVGLRAVAFAMVFVSHAWGHAGRTPTELVVLGIAFTIPPRVFDFGAQGVSLFFALSGFLLSIPFWRYIAKQSMRVNLRDFFRRRVLRIYPAYLVAVMIYATLHDTDHSVLVRLAHVVTHLALVHNAFEVTVFNLSAPLWSVATEFQLYLLLPLVFRVVACLASRIKSVVALAIGVALFGGLIGLAYDSASNILVPLLGIDRRITIPNGVVIASSPWVGLSHFSAGIAMAAVYVWNRGRLPSMSTRGRIAIEVSGVAAILALSVLSFIPDTPFELPPSGWPAIPLLFGAVVMLASFSRARFGIARVLEAKPFFFVGTISYSAYLFHDFVLWNVFNRVFPVSQWPNPEFAVMKTVVAGVITLLVAWLSYELLEKRLSSSIGARWRRYSSVDKAGALSVEANT